MEVMLIKMSPYGNYVNYDVISYSSLVVGIDFPVRIFLSLP